LASTRLTRNETCGTRKVAVAAFTDLLRRYEAYIADSVDESAILAAIKVMPQCVEKLAGPQSALFTAGNRGTQIAL